jgi:hypothetical protein
MNIKSDIRIKEYREQRAREAYLTTTYQPEALFDLSITI